LRVPRAHIASTMYYPSRTAFFESDEPVPHTKANYELCDNDSYTKRREISSLQYQFTIIELFTKRYKRVTRN